MYISSSRCTFPQPDVHFPDQVYISPTRCTFPSAGVHFPNHMYISLTMCTLPQPDVHFPAGFPHILKHKIQGVFKEFSKSFHWISRKIFHVNHKLYKTLWHFLRNISEGTQTCLGCPTQSRPSHRPPLSWPPSAGQPQDICNALLGISGGAGFWTFYMSPQKLFDKGYKMVHSGALWGQNLTFLLLEILSLF